MADTDLNEAPVLAPAPAAPPVDAAAERDAEIKAQRDAQARKDKATEEKRQAEADAKAKQTAEVDVKLVKEQRVALNGTEYVIPAGRWTRVPRGVFEQLRVVFGPPDRSQYNEYLDAPDSGTVGDQMKANEPADEKPAE